MPRKRREHEEHLEANEPVGVVILNDLAYVLEDLGEVLMDLGKLLRDRNDEVMSFVAGAKSGLDGLEKLLPPEVLAFLMQAGGQVAAEGMKIKQEVAGDASGKDALKMVDPTRVKPEMLDGIGKLLQKQAHGLEAAIAAFEKNFLAENPPG